MNTQIRLEIRPMRWWDIPAVDALERSLFIHDPWSVEQWWRELATLHNHYWVAESDNRIIGYAGLSVQAPDSDIQTIAIDSEFQGEGLGGQLLEAMIGRSRELGVRSIFLEVRTDNAAAIALYKKYDFEQISERRNYYPDGTSAIIMRRIESSERPS